MSEMLDRVANAICCPNGCENAGRKYDPAAGKVSICQAHTYEPSARAAIEAMREYTAEMEDAGDEAAEGSAFPARRAWEAMIDAALDDQTP